MTKQFNVGDTVKYTSPFSEHTDLGVVVKVNQEYFEVANGKYRTSYFIKWADGDKYWIADGNLSLVALVNGTVLKAKELKAELESEILRLIQEFNKKTNLEVQDIDLDCYRVVGGGCHYKVRVEVEI